MTCRVGCRTIQRFGPAHRRVCCALSSRTSSRRLGSLTTDILRRAELSPLTASAPRGAVIPNAYRAGTRRCRRQERLAFGIEIRWQGQDRPAPLQPDAVAAVRPECPLPRSRPPVRPESRTTFPFASSASTRSSPLLTYTRSPAGLRLRPRGSVIRRSWLNGPTSSPSAEKQKSAPSGPVLSRPRQPRIARADNSADAVADRWGHRCSKQRSRLHVPATT